MPSIGCPVIIYIITSSWSPAMTKKAPGSALKRSHWPLRWTWSPAVDAVMEDQVEEAVVGVRGQPQALFVRTSVGWVVVCNKNLQARLQARGLRKATAVEAQALGDGLCEQHQQLSRLQRVLRSNIPLRFAI
jgi:hypothetical protein